MSGDTIASPIAMHPPRFGDGIGGELEFEMVVPVGQKLCCDCVLCPRLYITSGCVTTKLRLREWPQRIHCDWVGGRMSLEWQG